MVPAQSSFFHYTLQIGLYCTVIHHYETVSLSQEISVYLQQFE